MISPVDTSFFGEWTRRASTIIGCTLELRVRWLVLEPPHERLVEQQREHSAYACDRSFHRPEHRRRHVLVESADPADEDVGDEEREEDAAHERRLESRRRRA